MNNTWYENTMCFDRNGNYNLSDDHEDTYDYHEDIYIQCCKCNDYSHPSKGQHDCKNNFICDECIEALNEEYEQNNKND